MHDTNPVLYCENPAHHDCELTTLCVNPNCSSRGLVCYLCPFTKPHTDHSQQDIVPIKLIRRGENAEKKHQLILDYENEIQKKQESHLKQLQQIKNALIKSLDTYEKQFNDEFSQYKNSIFGESDFLEKFERKSFHEKKHLTKSAEMFLKRLRSEETVPSPELSKWVYEENTLDYTAILETTKAYLTKLQLQSKQVKERLFAFVSDIKFPLADVNVEDYLKTEFLSKPKVDSPTKLKQRNEEQSFGRRHTSKSPIRSRISERNKKQKEKFTFGRRQDMMKEGIINDNPEDPQKKIIVSPQKAKRFQTQRSHSPISQQKDSTIRKNNNFRHTTQNNNHHHGQTNLHQNHHHHNNIHLNHHKPEDILTPLKNVVKPHPENITSTAIEENSFVDGSEIDAGELNFFMAETDSRFTVSKVHDAQRIFQKPLERFDAVTFYPKLRDVILEGFGFYCPLPNEGSRVDLEYIIYEGAQKDSQILLRDEVRFECDVHAVKERPLVESILIKMPLTLSKKKWYTLVLVYKNDIKVFYEEGSKWKDVAPFVFLGIEKKLVKEWLGVKSIETDKMYTPQFPYLIYSTIPQ